MSTITIQMENTVTKAELVALQEFVEITANRFRISSRSGSTSAQQFKVENERLRVTRRVVQKVHKLYKQGALVDRQRCAGGAGAPENCRPTENQQAGHTAAGGPP